MTLAVTILGCGSSGGVPRIGLGWGACDPSNPRNRRRRCSILVEQHQAGAVTRVLVDTSPDLREQLLDADVAHLDAVLYTHDHADHTHGIDDLRPIAQAMRGRVQVHADAATLAVLKERFGYCFVTPKGSNYPPILEAHVVTPGRKVTLDGEGGSIAALPFSLVHGESLALGYRFGGLAYTPDVNAIPADAEDRLRGLDVWIIDALRLAPHPSHFSLDEALMWIDRLKPRRAVLTNLHTDLDYGDLLRRLPPGVEPAYDGMQIAL